MAFSLPIPLERLKERLVEENLVTPEHFDDLVEKAEYKGQNITDVLVSEGIVRTDYLNHFLADVLGIEVAGLSGRKIDEDVLRLLPENIARERQTVLFGKTDSGVLMAAMIDPSDLGTIEYLAKRLGAEIQPFLATREDLAKGFSIYGSERTKDFKRIIEENVEASIRSAKSGKVGEDAAGELPVVAVVDNMLSYALSVRASDVHIEALEEITLVRYRIDGILYEIMRIPKALHPAVIARIKLLAGLKIDEHNEPQDGRFRSETGVQTMDVRVSIMPTSHGEKVVMRLLEATRKPLSFEELGMLPDMAEHVQNALKRAYGMILSCGPTGSGKTTTLYAILNMLNTSKVNIATIEDPVEYNIRYVNQSQINPQAGITFANGLRALLRQDPNIIMVGEIRDEETANVGVQAALTGHLLLSSLHTNDAPTAVPRLFDLNVPPFLVASVLNIVISQRLVRKICSSCIYTHEGSENVMKSVTDQFDTMGIPAEEREIPRALYHGKGCSTCNQTGYWGRLGIFEVIEMNDEMKRLVGSPGFSLQKLSAEVRKAGMRTIFEDGLKKVELGLTTVEEVLRVVRE